MLVVDQLTKRCGANTAVDNASFTVDRPKMIGIIGRSGAGKSTFLRMMNRLTDATEGERRGNRGFLVNHGCAFHCQRATHGRGHVVARKTL